MPISQDRSRAAAVRLREIAGPDLYRRNPFRVVGLATDARPAQVRARRHLLLGALDLGGAVPGDGRLPLPRPPSAPEVRAAFDALERPDHRLVDELFWWWGEPGSCGCPVEVHRTHDAAVEAHARALDAETDESLWVDAADSWMDALDHRAFWDHVRHRMAAPADRRMNESTVEGLRSALPAALLSPQVSLAPSAPRLCRLLDAWDLPAAVLDDARRTAAASTTARIDELVGEANRLIADEKPAAAADLLDRLPALADLLEELAPHEGHRWSATRRNRVAVTLNNGALALVETDRRRATGLAHRAMAYAVEERDRHTIAGNVLTVFGSSIWKPRKPAGKRKPAVVRQPTAPRIPSNTREPGEPEVRLPVRWPSNLAISALYVAAVAAFVSGLFGAPSWVSVVATVLFSWVPMWVVTSEVYRSLVGRGASVVIGVLAVAGGWWALRLLPPGAAAPFWWSCLAFVLVSVFPYAVVVELREARR